MADIYTVLLNSLRKSRATEPRHREEVYARGRIAYFRKLLSHRPRLDDEQIEDMMSLFDMAVAFVEADVAPTLPTRRTKELNAAVAVLLERQLANADFDAAPDRAAAARGGARPSLRDNIDLQFSEEDIAAEAETNTPDAYRAHVRQAAARVSQWTEMMVQKIDPASIAALSFASASARDTRVAGDWSVRPPNAARPTAEVRSPVQAPAPRDEPSRFREIRLLRTFFPQEAEDGTISPGRIEVIARGISRFAENLAYRFYAASALAHRERRQRALQPRVRLHTPLYDPEAARQRRARRNLVNRVMPPAAALVTVGIMLAITQFYGPTIVEKVEDSLRPREQARVETPPPPPPEPDVPKSEIDAKGPANSDPAPDVVLFEGEDTSAFAANESHPIKIGGDGDDRFVRITSSLTDSADARLVIAPEVADKLARREVHVVITARSALQNGAGTVRFAYQAGDETTAFVAQPLGKDYRQLEMVWKVPGGSRLGRHSILIEPGLLGGGNSIDIRKAVVYLAP